jgi:hypothetical protein
VKRRALVIKDDDIVNMLVWYWLCHEMNKMHTCLV